MSEGVLLSEQRDNLGDEAMSIGLLLSERNVESHDVSEPGVSNGSQVSGGVGCTDRLLSRHIPGPDREQHMQELSGGSILRDEHDESGEVSSGLLLSDGYSVRDAVPLSIGHVQHVTRAEGGEQLQSLHARVLLLVEGSDGGDRPM